jgi:hypothetical protein
MAPLNFLIGRSFSQTTDFTQVPSFLGKCFPNHFFTTIFDRPQCGFVASPMDPTRRFHSPSVPLAPERPAAQPGRHRRNLTFEHLAETREAPHPTSFLNASIAPFIVQCRLRRTPSRPARSSPWSAASQSVLAVAKGPAGPKPQKTQEIAVSFLRPCGPRHQQHPRPPHGCASRTPSGLRTPKGGRVSNRIPAGRATPHRRSGGGKPFPLGTATGLQRLHRPPAHSEETRSSKLGAGASGLHPSPLSFTLYPVPFAP